MMHQSECYLKTLQSFIECFNMPEIDLFTSRLDKRLHRYASWMPDPDALYIDAMSINWENQFVYLFAPFGMA